MLFQMALGLLRREFERLAHAGLLVNIPVDLVSSAFFGIFSEVGKTIADAEDTELARWQAGRLIRRLLSALRRDSTYESSSGDPPE